MATASLGVRERMAAASKRIARVKLVDRAATGVITFGGIFIILSVLFIFVFIFGEALPALPRRDGERLGDALASPRPASDAAHAAPLAVGVDEYQRYLYDVTPDGRVVFFRVRGRRPEARGPDPGARGRQRDGGVAQPAGRPRRDRNRRRPGGPRAGPLQAGLQGPDARRPRPGGARPRRASRSTPQKRPVRDVSYQESAEGEKVVAALVADDEIAVARVGAPSDDGTAPAPALETVRTKPGDAITHVRLGRTASLVATTRSGLLYHWDVSGGAAQLTDATPVGAVPLTAVEWGLGGNTVIVGDEKGGVSAWFRARPRPEADLQLVKAHEFESQGSAILSIGSSTRERSFVTTGRTAPLSLRHLTSERTLLRFPATRPARRRGPHHPSRRRHPGEARGRHGRALLARQPAPRVLLARHARQGLVRGLREARVRVAVDRRHRRLRAEDEPRPPGLRHDQGHLLRPRLRDPPRGHGSALHRRSSSTRRSRRRSSRRSRSWPPSPASSSASSPASGSLRGSRRSSCPCCC